MRSIALYGATGRTGSIILKKALEKGYRVSVLVRDPGKLQMNNNQLRIFTGDVMNEHDVDSSLKNCSGVISVIGHSKDSPNDIQERAINNIIKGMQKYRIHRLISLTGVGVQHPDDRPGVKDKLALYLFKKLKGEIVKDAINHANTLRNTNLDWTVVRVPKLNDKAGTGSCVIGNVGTVKGISLTREDLAEFILKEFEENEHVFEMPYLTNG